MTLCNVSLILSVLMIHCMQVADWMCIIVGIAIVATKQINTIPIVITILYNSKPVKITVKGL